MMRVVIVLAFLLLALQCVDKSTGTVPQYIFSMDKLWLWRLPAVSWILLAAYVALWGVQT
jgi:hypothetical protein